ncbi:MAG TPA: glycosyltransferase family 39 protein [Candidatus Acidoferrales bacterium]|nr:glycosyltransferase family 39 protein [Candidatus Acidoferrales bacterium]
MPRSSVAITADNSRTGESLPPLALGVLIALCAAKLLLHLFTSVRGYGYFRDELYLLDCGRHLYWGYVDLAPLSAVYARVALLMGGSLPALRIIPALAGTGLIALVIAITRQLGGNRFAQALAGLCVFLVPVNIVMDDFLSMNAFEPLFWMGCVYVLIRIIRTGNSKLWLWFGLLAGLGIENKHSTLFFGLAVFLAVLLTGLRREFAKPWIWLGGLIALLIFLPNLVWQIHRNFPTVQDLENVRRTGKNIVLGPFAFIGQQIMMEQPILAIFWITGLVSFLWGSGKRFRVLGVTFLIFFTELFILRGKDYYVAPIYPMMFAGGAVAVERWLARRSWAGARAWPKAAIATAIIILGGILVPLFTPMLSPERYLAYQHALHIQLTKTEVATSGALPQFLGDQIGWDSLVRQIADIYNSLPPDERAKTGIWAGNYGEAGAVNLFGPAYGLPRAYSRHQNYWYWGPPPVVYTNLIVVQWSLDDVRDSCTSFQAFDHYSQFGMSEENTPIYLCRGAKFDIQKIWWHSHHWN